MDSNESASERFDHSEGVLFIDGYFFLKPRLIELNDVFVKKTLDDLYRYVSNN